MSEDAFDREVRRRANALAWAHNWRGRHRAADLARQALTHGRPDEARLWRAVEARLEPVSPA